MDQFSGCHMVALPYPSRGHVNSMMNVCRLLSSTNNGLFITFVVTKEWLGLIASDATPPNVRLQSIPNVIPSEFIRAADYVTFMEAVYTKMEAPFELLLDRLELPAHVILADTFLSWAVTVGNRRNIPVASFWPMSPSVFSIFYHFDLLLSNGHFPVDISERGDEQVDYIPGVSSLRLIDLPLLFHGKEENIRKRFQGAVSFVTKAKCLLLASFYHLESHSCDTLKENLPIPVLNVGPCIPYMTLQGIPPTWVQAQAKAQVLTTRVVHYHSWLNSQPKGSVLYVALGSYIMVSSEQMEEMAKGLQASGVRFLWAARDNNRHLQEMCGEMGLVVPWCDQLKVLCHSSVGGFLTHCGWNSTMDGIFAGLIMLTFPLSAEQCTNSKLIVQDFKIGFKLKSVTDSVVRREEISRGAKRLMELEGDETKELRRRARELQMACKRSIEIGGSTYSSLRSLLEMFHNSQGCPVKT